MILKLNRNDVWPGFGPGHGPGPLVQKAVHLLVWPRNGQRNGPSLLSMKKHGNMHFNEETWWNEMKMDSEGHGG